MLLLGGCLLLICFILLGRRLYVLLEKIIRKKEQKRLDAIHEKLHHQFVSVSPAHIKKRLGLFLVAGLGISICLESPILIIVSIVLYLFLPFLWILWIEKTRYAKFQNQLLQFFPFLSSVLRSGHTLEKAIDQSCKNAQAPLSQEMDLVRKEMRIGHTFEQSLHSLLKRMPDPNLKIAISAIEISRKMGSNLAEAIDHIAIKIQEKEKLKNELKALTAQGRMQAWVTGLMPFVLMLGLQVIAPGYLKPLTSTGVGNLALGYCAVSMAIGVFWIYKIVNKEWL